MKAVRDPLKEDEEYIITLCSAGSKLLELAVTRGCESRHYQQVQEEMREFHGSYTDTKGTKCRCSLQHL